MKITWHKYSNRPTMLLIVVATIACAVLSSRGFGLVSTGQPPELSEPARKAIEKAFPQAKMKESEREQLTVEAFEVELLVDGKQFDVLVMSNGTILEVKHAVDSVKLPAAVRDGLAKIAAGAELKETEEIQQRSELKVVPLAESRTLFEAEVAVEGKSRTIVVDENGKQTSHWDAQEDDDGAADDDDDDDREDDE